LPPAVYRIPLDEVDPWRDVPDVVLSRPDSDHAAGFIEQD
jgi:hypothetical protein